MASNLAGLAVLLLAGTAPAQQSSTMTPYPAWNPPTVPVPVSTQPRMLPDSLGSRPLPPAAVKEPPVPASPFQRTALLQAGPGAYAPDSTSQAPPISLEPPGRERLIMLHSEAEIFDRWRQEARLRNERIAFPEEPILSRDPYLGRAWPERALLVEPNYVNYGRLLFEEKNSERYGWDLGLFGSVVSMGAFYKDVLLLPYHRFADPLRRFDSNAGYCLPGDPVPYMLYPEGFTITGAAAEAGALLAGLAIFP